MPVGKTEITMQQTRIFHTLSTLMVATVAATILAACASSPKIFVNQDPNADFSKYKTYNYEPVLGTDERKGYRSILSNYMVSALDREMQGRGYTLSDNPDLLVNFYIHTEEKIRTTQSPSMNGGYYGYRASKTAVNQIGTNLKHDLAPRGISVALLHPGLVATEMTGGQGITPKKSAEGLIKRIDDLNSENSGSFWHAEGYPLPW